MKHKTTYQLYSYWDRVRGARAAPTRTEIEPVDIREILADTFILTADDSAAVRYRLAGSRVCSAYCRELKGRDFLAFWLGHDRDALATLLEAVRGRGAAAVIGWRGRNVRRQEIAFETLLLPLQTRSGRFGRILGSTIAIEAPYWLGVHPILEQEVASLRMIRPNEPPARPRIVEPVEPAAPAVAVDPASGALARRFGHLLVYEGGKRGGPRDVPA